MSFHLESINPEIKERTAILLATFIPMERTYKVRWMDFFRHLFSPFYWDNVIDKAGIEGYRDGKLSDSLKSQIFSLPKKGQIEAMREFYDQISFAEHIMTKEELLKPEVIE